MDMRSFSARMKQAVVADDYPALSSLLREYKHVMPCVKAAIETTLEANKPSLMKQLLVDYPDKKKLIKRKSYYQAARLNHIELLDVLYDESEHSSIKNTLYVEACRYGHLDGINYFLEKDIQIDSLNNIILQHACAEGHTDVLSFCIERGMDLHKDKEMALRWASLHQQIPIIDFLIERGADYVFDDFHLINTRLTEGKHLFITHIMHKLTSEQLQQCIQSMKSVDLTPRNREFFDGLTTSLLMANALMATSEESMQKCNTAQGEPEQMIMNSL